MARQDKVLAFWALHSRAKAAIGEIYGPYWAIMAPIGETVLLRLAPQVCATTTGWGARPRWWRDWRMPAARFWPDGEIPCKHEKARDHARHFGPISADMLRAKARRWEAIVAEWRERVCTPFETDSCARDYAKTQLATFTRELVVLRERLAEAETREGTSA